MSGEAHFERVVEQYGPALRRVASAWERDPSAQQDLLQEILLALWRALPRFRGDSSERTFVFRVALNRALTHRERRAPRAEPLEAVEPPPDPRRSPEAEVMVSEQRARLVAAVGSLPIGMRQVLTLSLEGLSRAEIAEILGITENNATVRLSRARRALQEALTEA